MSSPDRRTMLLATTLWSLVGEGLAGAAQPPIPVELSHNPPSVIVDGPQISGIYPDFLRLLGQRIGIEFKFTAIPRARLLRSFLEGHESALLVPATRTSERDKVGLYLPMVLSNTLLVSLRSRMFDLADTAALLRHPGRVAVPRSYSWGDAYEQLLRQLEAQGRVDYTTDVVRVIERLLNGLADFSLLPASFLLGRLQAGTPQALNWQAEDFALSPLQGLPPAQIGIYLSRQHLANGDRERIRAAVANAVQDGSLLRLYQQYMAEGLVKAHVGLDHSDAAAASPRSSR